jgi:hypothetical protein
MVYGLCFNPRVRLCTGGLIFGIGYNSRVRLRLGGQARSKQNRCRGKESEIGTRRSQCPPCISACTSLAFSKPCGQGSERVNKLHFNIFLLRRILSFRASMQTMQSIRSDKTVVEQVCALQGASHRDNSHTQKQTQVHLRLAIPSAHKRTGTLTLPWPQSSRPVR